jgi:hypothetical protein
MTATGVVGTSAAQAVTDADGHPFVAQFQRYAEELLRPAALKARPHRRPRGDHRTYHGRSHRRHHHLDQRVGPHGRSALFILAQS